MLIEVHSCRVLTQAGGHHMLGLFDCHAVDVIDSFADPVVFPQMRAACEGRVVTFYAQIVRHYKLAYADCIRQLWYNSLGCGRVHRSYAPSRRGHRRICSKTYAKTQVLAELDEALSCQYGITNANIHEGKNPYIKFKNTGFTLSTLKQEESDAEPLQQFFPERHYLPLLEILAIVNRYSHWMNELQHWQQRHHCRRPSEQTVYAGVIAIGCTIGIRKMAKISHPISESALEHTVNWVKFQQRYQMRHRNSRSEDLCRGGSRLQLMSRLAPARLRLIRFPAG